MTPCPNTPARIIALVLFSGVGTVEHGLRDAHPEMEFISVDCLPAKHLTYQMDMREFCADKGPLFDKLPGSIHESAMGKPPLLRGE